MERTLLDLHSDVEDRKDLARSAEAADVLAETTGENDPASPRYQAGLRYDIRRDGRLISVTEFTMNIIGLTKRSFASISPGWYKLLMLPGLWLISCRPLPR